jgi:hypothetical protein
VLDPAADEALDGSAARPRRDEVESDDEIDVGVADLERNAAAPTGGQGTSVRSSVALPTFETTVLRRSAAVVLCVWAAARFLDVSVSGIVTNDSLDYLRHAESPLGAGFVWQGYRQATYPIIMAISNGVGDVLGWDHVFGVALVQRLYLAAAVVTSVWALRWWSVPVVAVATSETVVLHANFLLPEGFLIPSCLFVASLATAVAMGRVSTRLAGRVVIVAACLTACLATAVKLQYGVLLALAAMAALLLVRESVVGRRFAATSVGVALLFALGLATAQSFENRSELGVFEPVSERARAEWYGAWQAVFGLSADNRGRAELAEFYDGGNLYTFLHGVEQDVPDYVERAEIIRDRVDAMFDAAGTSARAEQFSAFIGALGVGRTDDLSAIVNGVLDARGDPIRSISFNVAARPPGTPVAVIDDYNEGHVPGIATFGPLLDPAQSLLDDHRPLKEPLAWLALVLMVAGLFVNGRHRPVVLAAVAVIVGAAAALATGYIDNARYLLGPLLVCLVGASLALRAVCTYAFAKVEARRMKRWSSPGATVRTVS